MTKHFLNDVLCKKRKKIFEIQFLCSQCSIKTHCGKTFKTVDNIFMLFFFFNNFKISKSYEVIIHTKVQMKLDSFELFR